MEFECDNCGAISAIKFEVFKKARGIHLTLFRCEHCCEEYPCFYSNAKIRKLQKEQREARDSGLPEKAEDLYNETERRMSDLMEKQEGREH